MVNIDQPTAEEINNTFKAAIQSAIIASKSFI